jgi:general secretion pathway protein L
MGQATHTLRQRLREWAAKIGLPALWSWWISELAPLMPSAPKTALRRRRARPMLVFENGSALLWEPRVTDGVLTLFEAGRISLEGEPATIVSAGRALIDALARRIGGTVKVLIALPRSQVLRKQFTLPAAIEENLGEALAFDLDRHTPFRPDQLYFDAAVIGRDVANRQIRVDWAAALKTNVDAAVRHAENWGAIVIGVTPDAPPSSGSGSVAPTVRWSKLNLLPEEERPETGVWRRPQVLVPAALVGAALLVTILLPIWQKRDYVIALNEVTEQARTQASASDALRQQLDQASNDYNFVLGRKYAYPSTIKVLDDVTRLLPDDTWLTQFEIKSVPKGKEPHREIMLRGESANAGRLISALEDSKLFEQAAPRSPTTKIQPGPGEVFDLGAQLKPLPAPEMIQLASLPRTTPSAGAAATGGAASPVRAAPPTAATPATPGVATSAPTAAAPAPPAPGTDASPAVAQPAPASAAATSPAATASAQPAGAQPPAAPAPGGPAAGRRLRIAPPSGQTLAVPAPAESNFGPPPPGVNPRSAAPPPVPSPADAAAANAAPPAAEPPDEEPTQ